MRRKNSGAPRKIPRRSSNRSVPDLRIVSDSYKEENEAPVFDKFEKYREPGGDIERIIVKVSDGVRHTLDGPFEKNGVMEVVGEIMKEQGGKKGDWSVNIHFSRK